MFGLSRTRSRRRVAATLAAVTAVGAAAVATTGVSSATVAAQSQGKIDKSAVLKMGVGIGDNGGSALDPASPQNINPYDGMWMDLIYDVMIHDTPDGKGAPGLAAKWSTPDPSTVELVLQPNVKFSDGSPFNAAAVKGAWDRMLAANLPLLYANLKAITNVEAVNDNTIRLHLNKPIAQTLIDQELHHSFFLGVPSPAAIAEGNLNTKPVGAGPYTATG